MVLKPTLVDLRYYDGMKGGTVALLYNLLLKLDEYYSKPINGVDEAMVKKMHNVFMSRWSVFHTPIHSTAFATDKQFCRREMDEGIKKDLWSVMEDFSKTPGGKDFIKMKTQYAMFVDPVASKQVFVSIIYMTLHYTQLCQTQLITLRVQYRFDDEVKDDAHGAFTPEMMKLPQATWIETFVEGVTDKSTGPIFKELVWFVYKVSGVMCSVPACEHCWSIEGWIHSKRRNKLHQKLVEKLVRAHTNLVMRESLDDALHHLLPWDIELFIDESVVDPEEEPEV